MRYLPPSLTKKRSSLRVHFGSLISGNIILASDIMQSEVAGHLTEYKDHLGTKPIGIEMEGVGAAIAVERLRESVDYLENLKFIMIRGVSDFADSSKNKDEEIGRHRARFSAASFAMAFIREMFFPSKKSNLSH